MIPQRPKNGNVDEWQIYLAELALWHRARDAAIAAQKAARANLDAAAQRTATLNAIAAAVNTAYTDTAHHADEVAADTGVIAAVGLQLATLEGEIGDVRQARDVATARLVGGPPVGVPLVLFPLRLETHWEGRTLHVRIYPDVISVDSHQPKLTDAERRAGTAYWQLRVKPGVTQEALDQAFERLARAVGPGRAAWIVHATAPSTPPADRRGSSFDVSVFARLLPDRFALVARSGGEPVNLADPDAPPTYVTWTSDVHEPLPLGVLDSPGTPNWMNDFGVATSVGLAVSIDVPATAPPIETLLCLGVRGTGAPDVTALITAHAYTDGAEILADGAESNNSGQISAAHTRVSNIAVARALIGPAPPTEPGTGSAGTQLADALGVPRVALKQIAGAYEDRGAGADAMRLIVGYGSQGALASALGAATAWPLVTPGGVAPALRVGRQPYGVLPVSAPARWQPQPGEAGAAIAAQLGEWALAVGSPLDVDPLAPPRHLGGGTARSVTRDEDSQLVVLLVEAASSLAYSANGGGFAGADQLLGPSESDEAPAATLARIAASDAASLGAAALPSTLLMRIAVAAKQHAAAIAGAAGVQEIARVDAALRTLAALRRDQLLRLFTELLDAASHRFDAWLTGVVAERLRLQRAAAPTSYVGAYGWLTGVAPRTGARSHGHMLAPSLGHAATAVVLRSGFLGERRKVYADRANAAQAAAAAALAGASTPNSRTNALLALQQAQAARDAALETLRTLQPLDPVTEANLSLAVDLSSERVRAARRTLRAVRAGQPLAAVLGYQFERDLISACLPQYLAAFRKLSRFHTGTALEALELARDAAKQALADATAHYGALEAVVATDDMALAAANAALDAANAHRQAAQQAAQPYIDLQNEEQNVVQPAIDSLTAHLAQLNATRPTPAITRRPITKPVIAGERITGWVADEEDITAGDDPGQAARWASDYAQTNAALSRNRARKQQIDTVLASAPAVAALKTLADAQRAAQAASGHATDAQSKRDSDDQAAGTYRTHVVQPAQAALDAAAAAISSKLAELLTSAQASSALTATVDGLALRERYVAGRDATPPLWDHSTIPFLAKADDKPLDPELNFPAVGSDAFNALRAVLDQLDARVDTVADLITAESVHQLVQGNPTRAGAALEIAASGSVPDDLDVIRTPRPGYDTTHRLLVAIDPRYAPAWRNPTPDAAARADPILAAWVSHHLLNPSSAATNVHRVDPDTGQQGPPLAVKASEVSLDPMIWIRLSADPAELEQRLAHVARDKWRAKLGAAADVGRVVFDEPFGVPFPALLAAASALRRVLATARALAASDLALPETPSAGPSATDATAVAARVKAVETLVAKRAASLTRAASQSDAMVLQTTLFAASALGVGGATPALVDGTPPLAVLQAQAAAAAGELHARLGDTPFAAVAHDPAATLSAARERVEKLCQMRLPLLTPVMVPTTGAHFAADLSAAPTRLANATPARLQQWLYTRARVRPAVDAFLSAYETVEAVAPGAAHLDVRATQLPDGTTTPLSWVGADTAPPRGGVSMLVQRAFSNPLPAQIAGLAVDAWNEVIPQMTHAPAVTFHYDQPDQTPPQAILVAVAPDTTPGRQPATWDLDTLLESLASTLALARDRAVTGEAQLLAGITVAETP